MLSANEWPAHQTQIMRPKDCAKNVESSMKACTYKGKRANSRQVHVVDLQAPRSFTMSRTNFGPLTTTWVQPSSCVTPIIENPNCINDCSLTYGKTCYTTSDRDCRTEAISIPVGSTFSLIPLLTPLCSTVSLYTPTENNACLPSIEGSATSVIGTLMGFYSPGLVCPNGYKTACRTTAGDQGNRELSIELTSGETGAGCCPE